MDKLIGCDLEYLVRRKVDNVAVPAGLLPIHGRKGHPEPLSIGGVEIDCCAVETTPPPANTEDSFVSNILGCYNAVREKYTEYNFQATPAYRFDPLDFIGVPYATEMGCQPDRNAWTGLQNPRPDVSKDPGLRSFGGHVHVEGGDVETIKALDLTLGVWSVMEDSDKLRRGIYGKAGAYRTKSYGVEYRVLSNFWTTDADYIRRVYRLVRLGQTMSRTMIYVTLEEFGGPKAIQTYINESQVDKCREVFMYTQKMLKAA